MSGKQNNSNNSNLTKEEQEQASAQKAGELAGRAAADYLTGGEYEKIRNAPVVGKAAKKAEEKVGNAVSKADKATGGKIGKVAKKADDVGALDAADKGMSMLGGSQGAAGKPGASGTPQGPKGSEAPNPISAPDVSGKQQNFAKNGLSGGEPITPPGGGASAQRQNLEDINSRKKEAEETSPDTGKDETEKKGRGTQKSEKTAINVVVEQMVKSVLIPMGAMLFAMLLLLSAFTSLYSDDNDLAAVDGENNYGGDSASYYSNASPEVKDFYNRVLAKEEEYSKKGKKINTMYITATYHVLKTYNKFLSIQYFNDNKLDELCEAMLGGSSTYSESNYRKYLTETFFPDNNCDEEMSERLTDEVFDYIEQYLEKHNRNTSCSSVSGGSCEYSFNGVHGMNVGAFSVSNLQVRLMSSSFCRGTDNVPLKEDLVPFENYVLGVTYGEIGQAFNTEVEKVHMIAARSFALARPYAMNGASGVKYDNNGQIIQLRACVADQVFCNTELGCSKDVPAGDQYGVVYSGKSHTYVYKDELSNYPSSTLKASWEETMGMVGVDKDGKVVEMGYYTGNGNKDDWVWKRWAEQGMDYVQIILSAYPEIKEIKKFGCNTTSVETDSSFLTIAGQLWKKVVTAGTYYYGGTSIPPSGNLIDCSSYVDWVLSEYGYDQFKGGQHVTQYFVTTNLTEEYGWTEIPISAGEDVTSKLQPGDILVRDPGNNNGHMDIIYEVKADGTVWGYDCGDRGNWLRSNNGEPIQISNSFVKTDSRPGKIIRVSNMTGNSCTTAATGEWATWRQIPPAPWANVPLGNSGRTIGGYGCFVTSIAIQIARSGAETTLSEFNPGTFVQELNKYGSFDGDGNFVGGGNIAKIVPSFETVGTQISLPGDKNGKIKTIQKYIDQGYYVILRVKTTTGQHWVAVIGTTSDGIQMVDPASDTQMVWDEYPVSESSTINVYKIG